MNYTNLSDISILLEEYQSLVLNEAEPRDQIFYKYSENGETKVSSYPIKWVMQFLIGKGIPRQNVLRMGYEQIAQKFAKMKPGIEIIDYSEYNNMVSSYKDEKLMRGSSVSV